MEYSKFYSFVSSTSDPVNEKIKRLKGFSRQLVGPFPSEHSKPHLTISVPDLQTPTVMANKCRRLIQDLAHIPSFLVTINNFGFFENSSGRVIYAKIELDDASMKAFKVLKANFDNETSFNPHITIARGLSLQQYEILWPYFKYMEYRRTFSIDSVLVLENEIVKNGPDQLFKRIPLGPRNLPPRGPWTLFDNLGV